MNTYIRKVYKLNEHFFAKNRRFPSMFIQTFGCQMNDRESEKLAGLLLGMGFTEGQNEKDADLVLYNTCCVRGKAEQKVYGKLGFLKSYKRENPDKILVMCGCMPQREEVMEELRKHHKHLDVIFGTFNKHHFPRLLFEHLLGKRQIIEILQELPSEYGEADDLAQFEGQTSRFLPHKAGVTIMHGCNNFCSYCIVPYVRGREKSRPESEIIEEIEALAEDGVREIMLLGQNVNSYGSGFPGLLRMVNEIKGIERIRFMTSHPKDLSMALIGAIRDCKKVCKHIHLPVQSGSNRILAAMNRGYTQDEYLKLLEYLRNRVPDMAITTDIIVGFPGETEEDFVATLKLVKKADFAGAYTFLYSVREGTPAADLKETTAKFIVKERFDRLLALVNPMQHAYNEKLLNRTVEVMIDEAGSGVGSRIGTVTGTGRTNSNVLVHFDTKGYGPGDIVNVQITNYKTYYVTGELRP